MNKDRKAEIKSLSPAQAVSARNTYVTNQFNRLESSMDSAHKPKLKIIADHGYTNFLDVTWGEVEAIKAVLTAAALPTDLSHGEVIQRDVLINGRDALSIEFWRNDYCDRGVDRSFILECVTNNDADIDGMTNLFHLTTKDFDLYCPVDQAFIRLMLKAAFPPEHCTHEYDCCGHLYMNGATALTEVLSPTCSRLSYVSISLTRNV